MTKTISQMGGDQNRGSFTYASTQGTSLIDMLLAREKENCLLTDFSVNSFNEHSDHAPLSFSLLLYYVPVFVEQKKKLNTHGTQT